MTLSNYSTIEVSSGIIIGNGAVLDGGTGIIDVERRWQNDGVFNCGTSTVTFYSSYSSTITGNTTFYCLTCQTYGKELRFEALSTQTVTGVLTLAGGAGNRIKLRSTIDGTTWYMRLVSSQTASYVDVKDANAIDYSVTCSESLDSGDNNDKWVFLAPDVTPPCAISNLTALTGADNDGDVKLTWTAPGDDGTSGDLTDGLFRIKSATYQVTTANFDSITDNGFYSFAIDISTSYSTPDTFHSYTMTGLNPGTTYYFGIMTRDDAGNWSSSWTVVGVNSANSGRSLDLVPSAPSASSISNSSSTINVSWSKPVPTYVDDLSKYYVYRATFSFSDATTPNVVHIATVTHPSNVYYDSGLNTGTTYYYRIVAYDKGDEGSGLFSEILNSALSNETSACPEKVATGNVRVSVVYDSRSDDNKNNYGVIDGIEDADGKVTFDWPFIPDGGTITNYFIQVSSDINFASYISSATIPPDVSTYTVSGLSRGEYYYARVKAKNSEGTTGDWRVSDGIYIDRKEMDSDSSDWTGSYAAVTDSVTVSGGDALWRDAVSDQRTDLQSSTQLDISSFSISCDRYNIYFFFSFNSTTTTPQFDGRNYFQIMIDNGLESAERVFRGNGNQYQDSYCSGNTPWEYLIEAKSGNDTVSVVDSLFGNTRYGKYAEHNSSHFYEIAIPLDYLGGADKFLGQTVNFTAATFWNDNGSVGTWGGSSDSNIVDVVTSSGTNTWNEVQDKVVDFYLAVSFSTAGIATAAEGKKVSNIPVPDEPEPLSNGVSPAPPSALDYILYNMFIDAWYNGDTSNDDISDTNDYGGDFQGVIDKIDYLNDMGINMAYFGPPTEFGGGIWGFNIDDAYKQETKFGGTSKYIEMVKDLHNHNIDVMVDWVCGQVGSKDSPTAKKNPDYFRQEQFGWGTKQEFAEARAFWLNNMIWYFSICDAFRYDNPKFWNGDAPEYGIGWEEAEFNRALRKISDRWDPQLFIMGEIPEDVSAVNDYTGTRGAMIHGGEDMRSGGYKDNRNSHICSWVREGVDKQSTLTAREGIYNQQNTWKNEWSINPIMMENHDETRFISRGRGDDGASWGYDSQVGYMTALTVAGPAIIFYGGEVGLEGPYDGTQSAKMDVDGNVRLMEFDRVNVDPWDKVQPAIRRAVQAKANFAPLRGDPGKGGLSFYSGGQYDGDVMVYSRTYGSQKAVVMMNRDDLDVSLTDVGTGDNSTIYKDFMTDKEFTTDGTGVLQEVNDDDGDGTNIFKVGGHYGRILIKGGYDWVNVTGTVCNASGSPIEGAIVDIDQKSHWTTTTDANGYYSISGTMKKVLTGNRTVRAWADGYDIVSQAKNFTTATINNNVSFTNASGYPLTVDVGGPSAPEALSAQPRNQAAMLSWQPCTEDDLQSYYIYRSQSHIPDGSFPAPVFEVFKTFYYDNNLDGDLDSNDNVINRLANGTTYYYRVKAVDRNGNKSVFSNEVAVVPRKVQVTFWVDMRDSGLSPSTVYIAGGSLTFDDNYWGKVPLTDNGDGTYQRTFEFDDTTFLEYKYVADSTWEGDTGYEFLDGSASSSNRGELTDDSVPDVEITDEGGGAMTIAAVWRYYNDRSPRTPAGIAVASARNQLTVSWTANAEPDLSYYTIQRSTYSSTEGFSELARAAASSLNYVDGNLENNNTYYYKINAVDRRENASSYTSVYSGFPRSGDSSAPAAPSGLAAYGYGADGIEGIKVTWALNSEGDLAGYNIHRSTESGFTVSSQNKLNSTLISPVISSYEDTGILLETTYYYKLAAIDSSGNASPSSSQLYARLVPVVFRIDTGNINPADVEILGNTEPLYWTASSTMAKSGSICSITLGFISGATIQYQFAYNSAATKEQNFDTDSGYREYLVPAASSTLNKNWEENPAAVSDVSAYAGVNSAYIYWSRLTTAEDLAGYNIYRDDGASGNPTILVNSSPVSYSQPYTVSNLDSGNTYSFRVLAADSCSPSLESSSWTVVSANTGSQVFVHFGVPYQAGLSSSPWGDSSRLKMYLAIMTSTDTSVWSSADRADVTNGLMEMASDADKGTYRATVPLLKGQRYNFLFFAETTSDPPSGLNANSVYYDTVQNTGTFITSTSSTSIAGPQRGVFYPVGDTRDARRMIYVDPSLSGNSTWYVYANFGSTPTAPTYIQAIPGNQKTTLYWSAPYGDPWVNIINNKPTSAGEAMKAVDVVCGGCYHIYWTTYTPQDFSSYKQTATVDGSVFSREFTGLSNGVTYYFLMRSSDTFNAPYGSVGANKYSVLSSTVSARPDSSYVVAKIRVNSNSNEPWPKVRKSIAFQEGATVSAWDSDGRSNMTPTGRAAALTPPGGEPDELEYSVNLAPGTTYNFLLFAYSTYTLGDIQAGTTYYDTVPASGSDGMFTTTSTITSTDEGGAWFGNVGGTGDSRRQICPPRNLSSGSTLYVFCNFSARPTTPDFDATPVSSYTVKLEWSPYGAWGTGGESMKAADVLAGGTYKVYRSSVSEAGPYLLLFSTSGVQTWTDNDRDAPGDNLGMLKGLEYFYVLVSSDAYCGDENRAQIPNLARTGAPEFSYDDDSAIPDNAIPVYFKVDYVGPEKKKIFLARLGGNVFLRCSGTKAIIK